MSSKTMEPIKSINVKISDYKSSSITWDTAFPGLCSIGLNDAPVSFSKEFIDALIKQLSIIPTVEHKCHNCGGTVKLDSDNHVFKCPYCDSVYAVGIQMVNSI